MQLLQVPNREVLYGPPPALTSGLPDPQSVERQKELRGGREMARLAREILTFYGSNKLDVFWGLILNVYSSCLLSFWSLTWFTVLLVMRFTGSEVWLKVFSPPVPISIFRNYLTSLEEQVRPKNGSKRALGIVSLNGSAAFCSFFSPGISETNSTLFWVLPMGPVPQEIDQKRSSAAMLRWSYSESNSWSWSTPRLVLRTSHMEHCQTLKSGRFGTWFENA